MEKNELSDLYRIRFSEKELPRKNEIWKVICADYLQKFIQETDTVVDIACGYGEFLNNIRARRKIGVDLNPEAQNFLNDEIDFRNCAADEFASNSCDVADVVFTSNFLEHLPDKNALNRLLLNVRETLRPGGKFIILGPNLRYLPGAYWDFYDHHLGLTHLSLCEALRLKGFDVRVCISKFLPYTTQGALPTHPWLVKLYLKLPMIWRLFGRQFFIVAQLNK